MSSRFYVTLPSNSSMDVYPNNTVARYTTKLVSQMELDGEWEVGLAEISIPADVENVFGQHFYYDIYLNDNKRRITLRPRHHKRMRSLIEAMNGEQRIELPVYRVQIVQFTYSRGKVSMRFNPPPVRVDGEEQEDEVAEVGVEFSSDLARLLGFDANVKYMQGQSARHAPSLLGDIQSVYVYCDIVQHVPVGDTKAPLLRIVDKPSSGRFGVVHRVLNPVLYVPVQKKNFDTVEINIMTDCGTPVPFLFGRKSFVVLEFRRAIHTYLGI